MNKDEKWMIERMPKHEAIEIENIKSLLNILQKDLRIVIFFYKSTCPYCIEFDTEIYKPMARLLHSSNLYAEENHSKPVFLAKFDGHTYRMELDKNIDIFPNQKRLEFFPHILFKSTDEKGEYKMTWPNGIKRNTENMLEIMARFFQEPLFTPISIDFSFVKSHSNPEFVFYYMNDKISPKLFFDWYSPVVDLIHLNQLICYLLMQHPEIAKRGKMVNLTESKRKDLPQTAFYLPSTKESVKYRDAQYQMLEWIGVAAEYTSQIKSQSLNKLCGENINVQLFDQETYQQILQVSKNQKQWFKSTGYIKSSLWATPVDILIPLTCCAMKKNWILKKEWIRYARLQEMNNPWGGKEILFHELLKETPSTLAQMFLLRWSLANSEKYDKQGKWPIDPRTFQNEEYKESSHFIPIEDNQWVKTFENLNLVDHDSIYVKVKNKKMDICGEEIFDELDKIDKKILHMRKAFCPIQDESYFSNQ